MLHLKRKNVEKRCSEQEYRKICNTIIKGYALTKEEKVKAFNNKIFAFVIDYPFLSGQSFPDEIAVLNAGTLIAHYRNTKFFQTRENQTIHDRVSLCLLKTDDDEQIRELALLLLEAASLNDHFSDSEKDRLAGKRNPVSDGIISFPKEKERIEMKINNIDYSVKEALQGYTEEIKPMGYWWD